MANLNPTASYSLALTIELPNIAGTLANVTQAIAGAQGSLGEISLIEHNLKITQREITIEASSEEHAEKIVSAASTVRRKIITIASSDLYFREFCAAFRSNVIIWMKN